METAVEIPLLCESSGTHPSSSAPEFSPSDFRLPTSDFEEQLPRSTFSPPPVEITAEDYDALIAELNRLEDKCQAIKMRLAILDFAEPVAAA